MTDISNFGFLCYFIFILWAQKYHPARVLTLAYQPFALGTLAILAYNEARINTRRRNLLGYYLFFLSSLVVLLVSCVITQSNSDMCWFTPLCVCVYSCI